MIAKETVIVHLTIAAIARFTVTSLIAAFFAYLYQVKKRPYLLAWTSGWCLIAFSALCIVLEPSFGAPMWLRVLDEWTLATGGLALFFAARLYANARARMVFFVAAAGLYAVWMIVFEFGKVSIPPAVGIALVFGATAWTFWKESRQQDTYVDLLMALVFLAWAPVPIVGTHYAPVGSVARQNFSVLAGVPQLLVAGLMVMAVYEEEKRRVERNMVALANLNLTTSSFIGSEIERTLSQALDRVLSVVRLPAGVILLHHKGAHGPAAAVSVGLNSSFCRSVEQERLDGQLMRLVARLGGLIVVRDIADDAAWTALENEDAFPRLRQLAIASGLRTLVGISFQTKEQPFGVLLVGTQDNRRFSSGELRLLLALGQQIGMAVENSYLIQETSRRSEELHVLNEIGRVLNSTLDPDALFGKIFTEMRRMFDVSNFFIALYDSAQERVRFELEISDGVRLPKRSRPAANHLTEYILRTREPLLLGNNMRQEAEKLGVQEVETGSFCGVPLLVHERAIGVLAVHSLQEHLYDQEHLEMMRVLASQASIAIENARLFRAEQTKSRHLTLLNNISRNAITTLNPDQMLTNIAQQIEQGLRFDHAGIGLVDHDTKEVVIHAEGGSRRGALGLRLPFGESLVGLVARTGQVSIARGFAGRAAAKSVLEDSASAIALPLVYAEQLHGVLYVESAEPCDFSEEDVLLLNTLADLISGALHNALTFQKAQEQAITDGLTGAKTHRFLMEALSAEWKRSTRAARAFSLVVIDLDRFKFVNDFYGHLEGDAVLSRVGHILEQSCRRSDVVARYGGDEFVILMPETDIQQGRPLAEKLLSALCADSLLREKNITASFGIASFPEHGSTPQELIQTADASMYLSKHQGGNAVSTAGHVDTSESKKWKRDVLEAYLSVSLKRLFSTGPEAFAEIRGRLEQFAQSLPVTEPGDIVSNGHEPGTSAAAAAAPLLPPSVIETLTSLSLAVDAKDHYTQGHSRRVADHAVSIAQRLGLNEQEVEEIQLGAMLHDIGKIGVPEEILSKTGPLDPEEWDTMKRHAGFGEQLLKPLQAISGVREMILHHHEMFDGSGYPAGLGGHRIPIGSRIIAIAEAYDSITSESSYKKSRDTVAALAEIARCAGAQFDPEIVQVFLDIVGSTPFSGVRSPKAAIGSAAR